MIKVRRPLATIGFTFFITGSIILSMPKEYTAILLALFALFIFIHSKTRRIYTKYLLLMLITALSAIVYMNIYGILWNTNITEIPTDTQEFQGYINEVNNADNTSYTITVTDEKGREKYKASIYYSDGYELGDTVLITGKFKPIKQDKYKYSSYADNILGTISADEMKVISSDIKTVKYTALKVRKALLDSVDKIYDNNSSAIVSAIAYNDSHNISASVKDSFKAAGLSHALVVSGFHIWIITAAVVYIFKNIPINKKIKNIIASVLIVGFMYIIGMSISVIRAGVLAAVILVSKNFRKDQDSLTTIALVGFISIICNPYITRDIGAMLSYSASVGLVLTNRWCGKRKIDGNKKKLICATMAVVFTMPVIALAGMKITILSPIFNLLLGVVISAICVLSVATPILNLIPVVNKINSVVVFANNILIKWLLVILEFIKEYCSFALVNLAHPAFMVVLFALLAAYFVSHFQFEKALTRKIFVTVVSILAFICYNLLNWNTVTVTAFDSGRECSFHITAKGKEYLVLSENITTIKAKQQLVSVNGNKFEEIYYCPKEFKNYTDFSEITDNFVEVNDNQHYINDVFELKSDISKNSKMFTVSVADTDIMFGHGKVTSNDSEYYFLGNDKPLSVTADEIYIFGNIPKWMNVENIYSINSDMTIKINLKTGEYKTKEDVLNFGW